MLDLTPLLPTNGEEQTDVILVEDHYCDPTYIQSLELGIYGESHFHDLLQMDDPLRYAQNFEFQPFEIPPTEIHHVKPHFVKGYFRSDGTYVEGHMRDGDGTGYMRSNPDFTTLNNLNK